VRQALRSETGQPTAWHDAVAAAAAAASALPPDVGGPIRERLGGLSGDLDATFDALRHGILQAPDLASVLTQAWDFAHAVAAAQAVIARITPPAGAAGAALAAARRTMQLTLAAMADYIQVLLKSRTLLRGS
jgi:hypothetical protein